MGSDFCLAKFPRFAFNDERKEQFRKALECIKPEDMEYLYENCYSVDDLGMLEVIEKASNVRTRETSVGDEYDKNGNIVSINYSGGMTWGPSPTDAYVILEIASFFESIYDLAMKFSSEDRS